MFNARPWESGNDPAHPNPPYKKHDFGYTVGGPVFIPNHYNSNKKKTFFFWSQEWRREKNPSAVSPQNVPSDAERSGDFTALCAASPDDCPTGPQVTNFHITPTATGLALLALIPEPNTTAGGFPAVSSIVSTPTTWREELIRVDHNITDNYRLTFRYIHDSCGAWRRHGGRRPNQNTRRNGPSLLDGRQGQQLPHSSRVQNARHQ